MVFSVDPIGTGSPRIARRAILGFYIYNGLHKIVSLHLNLSAGVFLKKYIHNVTAVFSTPSLHNFPRRCLRRLLLLFLVEIIGLSAQRVHRTSLRVQWIYFY